MGTILRFGGGGGGGASCPYPHVWECTAVKSGSYMVISGVSTLEPYDIIHFTCPVGQSATTIMINGTTYPVGFTVEGEMYIQYDGNDFVEVSSSGACLYPHVWTTPVYTITGTDLEITGGVDELRTNDVIVFTLGGGESASTITYNGVTYGINGTIDDTNTYYVQFNGLTFDIGLFTFLGDATTSDVASGKTFYSNSGSLLTGSAITNSVFSWRKWDAITLPKNTTSTITLTDYDLSKCIAGWNAEHVVGQVLNSISFTQSGSDVVISYSTGGTEDCYLTFAELSNIDHTTIAYSVQISGPSGIVARSNYPSLTFNWTSLYIRNGRNIHGWSLYTPLQGYVGEVGSSSVLGDQFWNVIYL